MDDVDAANDKYQDLHEKRIADIRAAASAIPAGVSGECTMCGDESLRLIRGLCAPCRDRIDHFSKG